MTRAQAAREARKRWGDKGTFRVCNGLSSPERRAEADTLFCEAKARLEAIDREIKERLAALDWYQALIAERRQVQQQKEINASRRGYRRFRVGQDVGYGILQLGEGDTWEEAFAEADARTASD